MTITREQLDEMRDELAYEWKAKDDGSIGHCVECFQEGFDAAEDALWPEVERLEKALEIQEKLYDQASGMIDAGCRVIKDDQALRAEVKKLNLRVKDYISHLKEDWFEKRKLTARLADAKGALSLANDQMQYYSCEIRDNPSSWNEVMDTVKETIARLEGPTPEVYKGTVTLQLEDGLASIDMNRECEGPEGLLIVLPKDGGGDV